MVFYPPEVKGWIFLSCFHGDIFFPFLNCLLYPLCPGIYLFKSLEASHSSIPRLWIKVLGFFPYALFCLWAVCVFAFYCLSSLQDVKAQGRMNPSIILCLHHTLCMHIEEELQVRSPLERHRAWRGTQRSSVFWIWHNLHQLWLPTEDPNNSKPANILKGCPTLEELIAARKGEPFLFMVWPQVCNPCSHEWPYNWCTYG